MFIAEFEALALEDEDRLQLRSDVLARERFHLRVVRNLELEHV